MSQSSRLVPQFGAPGQWDSLRCGALRPHTHTHTYTCAHASLRTRGARCSTTLPDHRSSSAAHVPRLCSAAATCTSVAWQASRPTSTPACGSSYARCWAAPRFVGQCCRVSGLAVSHEPSPPSLPQLTRGGDAASIRGTRVAVASGTAILSGSDMQRLAHGLAVEVNRRAFGEFPPVSARHTVPQPLLIHTDPPPHPTPSSLPAARCAPRLVRPADAAVNRLRTRARPQTWCASPFPLRTLPSPPLTHRCRRRGGAGHVRPAGGEDLTSGDVDERPWSVGAPPTPPRTGGADGDAGRV